MAKRPLRECLKAGCHSLTRDGYCDEHKMLKVERHKIYDNMKRNKKANKFYHSAKWKKAASDAIARANGLCLDCLAEDKIRSAEMVHHIKPLRQYPELALEPKNLKPLCNKCHGKY